MIPTGRGLCPVVENRFLGTDRMPMGVEALDVVIPNRLVLRLILTDLTIVDHFEDPRQSTIGSTRLDRMVSSRV